MRGRWTMSVPMFRARGKGIGFIWEGGGRGGYAGERERYVLYGLWVVFWLCGW
jgi:hypothetical protein